MQHHFLHRASQCGNAAQLIYHLSSGYCQHSSSSSGIEGRHTKRGSGKWQAVASCIQMSRRVCPQRTLTTGDATNVVVAAVVVTAAVVVVVATVVVVVAAEAPLVLASVNLVDCFSRATFVTMLHAVLQRALSKGDRPRRATE